MTDRKEKANLMSGTKTFYIALGIVAVAGGAWVAYTAVGRSTPAEPPSLRPLTESQASLQGGWELGVSKGDVNAPVVVQEFADYQCPFCAQFAALTGRALDEQYVKTGKVRWIFFDFPLRQHGNALPAAEAARCAGEAGQYWPMHDLLFARQPEWAGERSPKARFTSYARALGLDASAFESCLDSGRHRDVIRQSYQRGLQIGVEATPSFFVNGKPVRGAAGYADFARMLDEALAAARSE